MRGTELNFESSSGSVVPPTTDNSLRIVGRGESYGMRAVALAIVALMLGGCMQETLAPTTQAGWSPRDRQLMSNLPYTQATIPEEYRRHIVSYTRKEVPGTIVVDTGSRFLYYVLPKGQAIRYGITVGEDAQAWSGIATVGRKEEWPSWTP